MKIEIKSRWGDGVPYSGEYESVKEAVEAAATCGANLCGADLRGADLRDANLCGANLRGADLRDANLRGADLSGADLRGANLCGADLSGADLCGADLSGADLRDANLCGANLCGADLRDANLCGAYLCGADLSGADLSGADLSGADLCGANLCGAYLRDAMVGTGEDQSRLVGVRPVIQVGPIGSRNDWLLVFWCGDAGLRISTGCQNQITEQRFLERLASSHGQGGAANVHAQHYIEALAFAKRLLKDQAEGKL